MEIWPQGRSHSFDSLNAKINLNRKLNREVGLGQDERFAIVHLALVRSMQNKEIQEIKKKDNFNFNNFQCNFTAVFLAYWRIPMHRS